MSVYTSFHSLEDGSIWEFIPEDDRCDKCKEMRTGVDIAAKEIEGGESCCFIYWDCLNTLTSESKK